MKKIIHVDMDCFYAAVEMRDDPSLNGIPLAVGGSPDDRGVIATANYEAREYGVHSAMASKTAFRKCPDLTLIPPNFDTYREESRAVREILRTYTDRIEPLSLDEAYLDVTKSGRCGGSATKMAKAIRERIREERNLTASAGVAPNKFLAKVASDWNKPDGQKTVPPDEVSSFVESLEVSEIPGVGSAGLEKLHKRDIHTCGDLQNYSRQELHETFGKWGLKLFHLCRGEDDRPVEVDRERKSLSVERTFSEDLERMVEIRKKLRDLYEKFRSRWNDAGLSAERMKAVFVKVKFADFQQITRERRTRRFPSIEPFERLVRTVRENDSRPIRLIGVGVQLCSRRKARCRIAQNTLFRNRVNRPNTNGNPQA